jgi:hypothetical protein
MRVTTDLWVSALLRRVFAGGGFAAVVRRGAAEAGAVFVLSRDRLGGVALYGPAPQTAYGQAKPDERLFDRLEPVASAEALEKKLERESRFDPDIWIVEIEAGTTSVEDLIALRTP